MTNLLQICALIRNRNCIDNSDTHKRCAATAVTVVERNPNGTVQDKTCFPQCKRENEVIGMVEGTDRENIHEPMLHLLSSVLEKNPIIPSKADQKNGIFGRTTVSSLSNEIDELSRENSSLRQCLALLIHEVREADQKKVKVECKERVQMFVNDTEFEEALTTLEREMSLKVRAVQLDLVKANEAMMKSRTEKECVQDFTRKAIESNKRLEGFVKQCPGCCAKYQNFKVEERQREKGLRQLRCAAGISVPHNNRSYVNQIHRSPFPHCLTQRHSIPAERKFCNRPCATYRRLSPWKRGAIEP